MTTVGSATIELLGDARSFERAMDTAAGRMQSVGRRMQSVGASLTASVTLPIIGIGAAAGRASAQFETAMTGVAKTVDAPATEIARLGREFKALSEEIPTSAIELAKIGELAGQLGVQTRNIRSFTETIAALGVSTNLSSEMAATSLARLSNIMGTAQTDVDRLGATIVDLGNNLATTEAEITTFALRIAGAGELAGLAESDVLAIGGALSSVGIQAEAGGTAVQKALIQMNTAVAQGNEQLTAFAETAGMTAQEFTQQWESDPARAFQAFIEGLGTAGDDATVILEGLFDRNQRLTRAFLALANAGDLLGGAIDRGNQAWADNTALTEEASKFYDRLGAAFASLRNKLTNVTAELGDALRPAFDAAIEGASGLLNLARNLIAEFASLSSETRKQVAMWFAIAAALGPVLIALGTVIHLAGGLTGIFATIIGFVNPVTLGLSAIAIALRQQAGSWSAVGRQALDAFNAIIESVTAVAPAVFESIKPALNFMIGAFVSVGHVAVEAVQIAIEGWGQLWDFMVTGASESGNFIVRAFATVVEEVTRFARIMAFEIGSALGTLQESEDEALQAMGDIGQRMADAAVAGFGTDYVGAFVGVVGEGVDAAQSLIERWRRALQGGGGIGGGGEDEDPTGFNIEIPEIEEAGARVTVAFEKMRVAGEDVAGAISSGFGNMFARIIDGSASVGEAFADFAKGVIANLAAMIAQALVFNAVMGFLTGGTSFAFGAGGGRSLFGIGARAHGGPVTAGRPYMVGEQGPELIVPSSAGQVVPNNQLAGGPDAGAVASAILARVGPQPSGMSPREAARDSYWREMFRELARDHGERT